MLFFLSLSRNIVAVWFRSWFFGVMQLQFTHHLILLPCISNNIVPVTQFIQNAVLFSLRLIGDRVTFLFRSLLFGAMQLQIPHHLLLLPWINNDTLHFSQFMKCTVLFSLKLIGDMVAVWFWSRLFGTMWIKIPHYCLLLSWLKNHILHAPQFLQHKILFYLTLFGDRLAICFRS